MNKKEIAMRIKSLREDRHIHQKEVASVLGISQSAYSDLENGHTAFTAVALDKLAEYYGMSLDEFLHADKVVMNMNDSSSQGYNAYHMQHQHGFGEDTSKKLFNLLSAAVSALDKISEQQAKLIELLSKSGK
ncbi:MAG: helix-turn-helix transcriptional regulator [Flavobacteriales bacterium]